MAGVQMIETKLILIWFGKKVIHEANDFVFLRPFGRKMAFPRTYIDTKLFSIRSLCSRRQFSISLLHIVNGRR